MRGEADLWTQWDYQRSFTDKATGQIYNTKEQLPFSCVPLPSLLSMDDDLFLPSKSEVSMIMNTSDNYGWKIYTKDLLVISRPCWNSNNMRDNWSRRSLEDFPDSRILTISKHDQRFSSDAKKPQNQRFPKTLNAIISATNISDCLSNIIT